MINEFRYVIFEMDFNNVFRVVGFGLRVAGSG